MLINLDKDQFISEDEWDRSLPLADALAPNWFLGALAYLLGFAPEGQNRGPLFSSWRGDCLLVTGENATPLRYFRGNHIREALDVTHDQETSMADLLPDATHLAAQRFHDITGPVTLELIENEAYLAALGRDIGGSHGASPIMRAFQHHDEEDEGDPLPYRPPFGNHSSDELMANPKVKRVIKRAKDAHLLAELELLERYRPEVLTPLARVELAHSDTPIVRQAVAGNPNANLDDLLVLAAEFPDEVQANPGFGLGLATDPGAVERAFDDDPKRVMELARTATGALREHLIAGTLHRPQIALLLHHDDLSGDEVRRLAALSSAHLSVAAGHPNAPAPVLEKAAEQRDPAVRERVALHPNTPPELLARLATDPHPWVAAAAARNPRTSDTALWHLAGREEPTVRQALLDREDLPALLRSHLGAA